MIPCSEQIRVIFQTILILVFFTWVILWKSHNNISFVLRRSFTLLARRSSLLVSVLEKHETGSPNTHRSHPCYSSRDVKQRNTRISNCLESLLTSFVVALIPWKKQATSRDDADMYPLNILVRTMSLSSSKNIQNKFGQTLMQCSCHNSCNMQVQAPNDLTSKVQSNSVKKLNSIVSIIRGMPKKRTL